MRGGRAARLAALATAGAAMVPACGNVGHGTALRPEVGRTPPPASLVMDPCYRQGRQPMSRLPVPTCHAHGHWLDDQPPLLGGR